MLTTILTYVFTTAVLLLAFLAVFHIPRFVIFFMLNDETHLTEAEIKDIMDSLP